jgi:hypothetical protein
MKCLLNDELLDRINATVVGSKQTEKEEEADGEEAGEDAEESKD